jgi:hypothetical protein
VSEATGSGTFAVRVGRGAGWGWPLHLGRGTSGTKRVHTHPHQTVFYMRDVREGVVSGRMVERKTADTAKPPEPAAEDKSPRFKIWAPRLN